MNQSKIEQDTLKMSDILIPVWSHQHGAYISLITGWLIGTLLSESVSLTHAFVIVFLLAGLNLGELVQEYLKKKFAISLRKKIWIILYGLLTTTAGFNLLNGTITFNFVFPVLIAIGFVYLYLSLRREHKHVYSELLAFAAITLGGLIAFNPDRVPGMEFLRLWALLFAYFGTSVFLVKARFDKVSSMGMLLYYVFCLALTLWVVGFSSALICVLFLIGSKLLIPVFAGNWFKRLPISRIGFIECAYCIILVTVLRIAH